MLIDNLNSIELEKYKRDWEVANNNRLNKEKMENVEEVREVKTVEVETRIPQALGSDVVILNPLTKEISDEIALVAEKLPKKDQQEYLNKRLAKLWKTNIIVNVGSKCIELKAGDECISGQHVFDAATGTPNPLYLIVRESIFKAKW